MLQDQSLSEGDTIGGYIIRRVLGAGSFGITYLAYDKALTREVALKEYFPVDYAQRAHGGRIAPRNDGARDVFAWGLERFEEEARTLARFRHPNIVGVLQLITGVNGTGYIAMDLLDGKNLEEHVQQEGVPDSEGFVTIFNQLLDGAEAIHKIGILHRDIKPSNIVMQNGQPVLIDFGSARDLALQRGTGFSAVVTDGYSPLEQYSRSSVQGPYTDIYALAATAQFLLTGVTPPSSAARADGDALPAVSPVRAAQLWPSFLTGIERALSLRAAERPQSIADWRTLIGTRPEPEQRKKTKRADDDDHDGFKLDRRMLIVGGVGAAAVAVVSVGVLKMMGGEPIRSSGSKPTFAKPLSTGPTMMPGGAEPDPYPQIVATATGAIMASMRPDDGGGRGVALRLDDDGKVVDTYVSENSASRFHVIVPAPDGGAFVGGGIIDGKVIVARLSPGWTKVWENAYGADGSITGLALTADGGVIGGVEGKGMGAAELLKIGADGTQGHGNNVSIDPSADSVQRLVALPGGGYAVLGLRLDKAAAAATGGTGVSLWVVIVDDRLEEVKRARMVGNGAARGWDIAAIGDYIYVTGNTDKGTAGARQQFLVACLDKKGNTVWPDPNADWAKYGEGSGRTIALSPDGGLFIGGQDGGNQPQLLQVGPEGALIWSAPKVLGDSMFGSVEALSMRDSANGFAVVLGYTVGQIPDLYVIRLKS